MLTRSLSDRSNGVRRTRSSASINRRNTVSLPQDIIDPKVARHHAIAAAHVAMERAQERASAEMVRSFDLGNLRGAQGKQDFAATSRSHFVRFDGAAELRRQRSLLRQRAPSLASSLQLPDDYIPPSFPEVQPLDEFGMPIVCGSVPSSYRRLRKARSMITPSKRALSIHSYSPRLVESPHVLRQVQNTIGGANTTIRLGLRRSLSFLKGSHTGSYKPAQTAPTFSEAHDAAIQIARDQYQRDLDQQQSKSRDATFPFSLTARRHQKAFRKTVRSGRKTTYGDPIASPSQPQVQVPPPKATSFSLSIRKTMKRVFGRSSSAQEDAPVQHADATRPHFRDYVESSTTPKTSTDRREHCLTGLGYGSVDHPSPAIPTPPPNYASEDQAGERSRVTSWADSTMADSVANSLAVERKRLSIIQEHGGPYQPSSSAGRHIDGISTLQPSIPEQLGEDQPSPPIDPQRVYSALMRRIDEAERGEDKSTAPAKVQTVYHEPEPYYASSDPTFRTAPTIRAVPSKVSIRSESPGQARSDKGDFQDMTHSADDSGPTPPKDLKRKLKKRSRSRLHEASAASFFPFSSEEKPETPSPFRKVTLASRSERTTSNGTASVIHHQVTPDSKTTDSESMYSRTTGGRALNSSPENLPSDADETPGMATILTSASGSYARPISALAKLHDGIKSTSSTEWRSWMSSQIASIERRKGNESSSARSDQTHFREHAQIDDDDSALGRLERGSMTALPHQAYSSNVRLPLLEVKSVRRSHVPEPCLSSDTDLKVEQSPHMAVTYNNENARENIPPGQRNAFDAKVSQLHVPSFLKGTHHNTTPPELRKKRSAFTILGDLTPTPKSYSAQYPRNHDQASSITNATTGTSSADASPNDGKAFRSTTTSDVRRVPLGRPLRMTPEHDIMGQTTATAAASDPEHSIKFGISSKRMVSNFLRSRRKVLRSTSATEEGDRDGSTEVAFL